MGKECGIFADLVEKCGIFADLGEMCVAFFADLGEKDVVFLQTWGGGGGGRVWYFRRLGWWRVEGECYISVDLGEKECGTFADLGGRSVIFLLIFVCKS